MSLTKNSKQLSVKNEDVCCLKKCMDICLRLVQRRPSFKSDNYDCLDESTIESFARIKKEMFLFPKTAEQTIFEKSIIFLCECS